MTQAFKISEKFKSFPARPDKTIDWLNKSRDDWKSKTQTSKAELKVAKQAQKRARTSREQWKEHCEQLKADQAQGKIDIAKKDAEIGRLEAKVAQLVQEKEDLKKSTGFVYRVEDRTTHL